HLAVDSCRNPIDFVLTGGEVHDSKAAPELVAFLPDSETIVADRGYDCEAFRALILTTKAVPVIPRRRNSKVGNQDIDWYLYRYCHLVENAFAFLKQYRAIATRYDKLARNYAASLAMICCIRWGRLLFG
ncbi:IS5 family transposase, partial [Glaesserella parasuis]|uniref:IS5 family transposase n=1 Tax=Glaesserella parasuis TaxID=738 RepID=UPI00094FA040